MEKILKNNLATTNLPTTTAGTKYTPCHTGPVEVYPRILVGSLSESIKMANEHKVDILVPLDSLHGDVWDKGWRGEIHYVPVRDMSILPRDVLLREIDYLLQKYAEGKSIGVFCIGGHGRTGYFASVLLGRLGVQDPIKLLREKYCSKVLETKEQIKEVAEVLGRPELEKYEPAKTIISGFSYYDYWDDYGIVVKGGGAASSHRRDKNAEGRCCGECAHFLPYSKASMEGTCLVYDWEIFEDDVGCNSFLKKN